jgi:short-subunit dehydrogenase
MKNIFKDKVVIVTGASFGIGEAIAREFAVNGSKVVLAARTENRLMAIVDDLKSRNCEACYIRTDVTVEADCRKLVESTIEKFGKIDILVNNAGISMRAAFIDVDLKVLHRLMDVNFWGTVYCTKYAMPYLLQNKGSVVAVSSVAGIKGLPGRTGYSASKFAIHGFMESLRIENLKTGLHVLMAYPGFTASNIRNTALVADGKEQGNSPLNEDKIMTAESVAMYIYKAVKNRKTSLVLTTEGKLTVLLNKFFSSFLDKIVFNKMAKEPDSPFK